ncbi:L,D-transpeptidase family protein [Actinomadura flavalba]|uniref:L,D-transpeptidase family protein n=1 Tax=Actinomadura flavalba TaxID=1120938 RepID=UPI000376FE4A|nr:L,D-transpeptidase family protein [Actinomadura flavalba]
MILGNAVLATGLLASQTDVQRLQQRLRALHYDPGAADGRFRVSTLRAVWAFQAVHGLRRTGVVDRPLWSRLAAPEPPRELKAKGRADRVEVDLKRHVMVVYRKKRVALISHISGGSGKRYCAGGRCTIARTPTGDFRVIRRIDGWREARLGRLYKPLYFQGGYAVHGARSVPRGHASHGCVRIPMSTANRFARIVKNGTPVHIRR